MNRRQLIALEGANPSLFNKNTKQSREYVTLKGLELSTVLRLKLHKRQKCFTEF